MNRTCSLLALALAGLGLLAAAPAAAQDAVYLRDDAGHCEIFRSLSRVVPGACAQAGDRELGVPGQGESGVLRTRGFRLGDQDGAAGVAAVAQSAPPAQLALAMRVPFEFDSFNLTPEAMAVLDRIAAVLKNELMAETVVRIEGHTDAWGPEAYNLTLSQLRARSVRAYLILDHGLDPERLPFVGQGESRPYDAADPFDGINRRVEFHNLTG